MPNFLTDPTTLLWTHAAVTWALIGLIWTIQVVHYPLMPLVGASRYPAYQAQHVRRITWLVGPLMIIEALLAGALVASGPQGDTWMRYAGLGLVVVIWVSTVALQMPMHEKLREGFDAATHQRLVRSNWIRTLAWTARGVLAILLLG